MVDKIDLIRLEMGHNLEEQFGINSWELFDAWINYGGAIKNAKDKIWEIVFDIVEKLPW